MCDHTQPSEVGSAEVLNRVIAAASCKLGNLIICLQVFDMSGIVDFQRNKYLGDPSRIFSLKGEHWLAVPYWVAPHCLEVLADVGLDALDILNIPDQLKPEIHHPPELENDSTDSEELTEV